MSEEKLSDYAPRLNEALKDFEKSDFGALKACPFCGSEAVREYHTARIVRDTHNERSETTMRVKCNQCGISTGFLPEEVAVLSWNRRCNDA